MKLRYWAGFAIALYGIALGALAAPLLVYGTEASSRNFYSRWEYWGLIGVLTLLEGVALLVPLEIARERPVARRRWTVLAMTASFLMGLLMTAAAASLAFGIWGDRVNSLELLLTLAPGLAGWAFWGVLFMRARSCSDPSLGLKRVTDPLLAGSIAELLIAVPSHVLTRQRNDCCAPGYTFLGIAAGLCVLFFAYGPVAFLLFARRMQRLLPRRPAPEALP